MAVASLFEIPKSAGDLQVWSFANAAHHRDINRVVYELQQVQLPDFFLDPFDPSDMDDWLYQHQQMHNAQNAVLGIAGFNLLELNWRDPEELLNWMEQHALEHVAAGQILNLG